MITFLLDSKNWNIILFVLIMGLVGLFLYQKSRTQNFKYKYEEQIKETNRFKDNLDVSKDSLKIIKDKNGNLIGEISGYKLTIDELNGDYNELFTLYEFEKNKPPKFITETNYIINENISEIPTFIEGDSLIKFTDSINYGDGNWRIVKSEIPYKILYRIKKDSVNNYALNKALNYSFYLQQRGLDNAKVVIYNGNKRINYNDINKSDSLNFRIQFYEDINNISIDEISQKFSLDKDYIYKSFEDNKFKYMTGFFVPKKNLEPLISVNDIDIFSSLKTLNSKTNLEISMNLMTSLYKDEETGKIKIQVKTKYPGITFTDLKGAEIISTIKDNKDITNQFKKEWSLGIHFGYGAMLLPVNNNWEIKRGPNISIGINYNPKWLQFGTSNIGKNTLNELID
jgi:hypothetical protein